MSREIQQLLACKDGCSAGRLISCLDKLNSRRQRRRQACVSCWRANRRHIKRPKPGFRPLWLRRREATRLAGPAARSNIDGSTRLKDVHEDPSFQFTASTERHRTRLDYSNRRRVITHIVTTPWRQLNVTTRPEMPGPSRTLTEIT